VYTNRSCHSTTPGLYSLPHAGQPNAACRVPSSTCEPRWNLEIIAAIEVTVVRLRPVAAAGPAPAIVPVFACNTSQ